MDELSKIEKLTKRLNELQPFSVANQNNLDKKLRLEFNYNTNHIEGNTLTYSETELLLIFDDTKGGHSLRELEEMKGSDVAFHFIQDIAKDKERPLTEQIIKYLNEILLVRPFWKDAITEDGQSTRRQIKVGEYKEYPNSVRLQNGEIFHYATPIETPALMSDLIDWFRNEENLKELHPIQLAAMLHYKFVRIHPFDDGNGRVSRLLMNYVLYKNDLPPVVIKSEHKKDYLSALNRADAGDIESFTRFIAQQLIWSLELSIKAANGESLDEPGDLDKKIKLLKQKLSSPTDKVQIFKNKEAILELFKRTLEPLFLQITEKLKKFDVLFKSSDEYFKLRGSLNNRNANSINQVKKYLESELFDSIEYDYHLNEFRSKSIQEIYIRTNLKIHFHKNVYEILLSSNNLILDKLYNEDLTEDECLKIVESIGTDVYNEITGKADI